MALFSECSLKCARKVLDTADIVRECARKVLDTADIVREAIFHQSQWMPFVPNDTSPGNRMGRAAGQPCEVLQSLTRSDTFRIWRN